MGSSMKKIHKVVLAGIVGLGVAVGGAQAASAATFYDHINYGSFLETRSSGNLTYSDRASSVRNSGSATYCENNGCAGRKVTLSGDYNDLRSTSAGLGFGETWSDRISAVQ